MARTIIDRNHNVLTHPVVDISGAQIKAYSSTSVQSSAVNSDVVRLVSTSDCWVTMGANPTAAAGAGSFYLPAKSPLVVNMTAGNLIAVIRDTADGTLSILPSTSA